METRIKLTRAHELGVAIRVLAIRMVGVERDVQRGMWLSGGAFLDSPEYKRLSNRQRYQERALARLVFALTDLAKVEQVRSYVDLLESELYDDQGDDDFSAGRFSAQRQIVADLQERLS